MLSGLVFGFRLSLAKWLILPMVLVVAWFGQARVACAEAAPTHFRSAGYYAGHGAANVGAFVLAALIGNSQEPGGDPQFFLGDPSVRHNWAPAANHVSNWTLGTAIALPVVAEFGHGVDSRLLNFTVVYAQALAANSALNSVVKRLAARPRPCTYDSAKAVCSNPGQCQYKCNRDGDRYASFYSGHSSAAFATATAGSLLVNEGLASPYARAAFSFGEFALAAATANLRVKAGKHYYSDVLVGMLVGVGVGLGVPLLHGGELPRWQEGVGAGAGFVTGLVVSQLYSFGTVEAQENAASVLRALRVSVPGPGSATVSWAQAF